MDRTSYVVDGPLGTTFTAADDAAADDVAMDYLPSSTVDDDDRSESSSCEDMEEALATFLDGYPEDDEDLGSMMDATTTPKAVYDPPPPQHGDGLPGDASSFTLNNTRYVSETGVSSSSTTSPPPPSPPLLPIVTTSPPPRMTGRFPVALYLSCNPDHLSPYQCLVRKHVQFFEAGPDDVAAIVRGRNKPILLGQVGVQCSHCAGVNIPPSQRAKGAMYYPGTLDGIYQAVQVLATVHLLDTCRFVPDSLRKELIELRTKQQQQNNNPPTKAGKGYWATTAEALGVYEDGHGRGLRFAPSIGTFVCPKQAVEGREAVQGGRTTTALL